MDYCCLLLRVVCVFWTDPDGYRGERCYYVGRSAPWAEIYEEGTEGPDTETDPPEGE